MVRKDLHVTFLVPILLSALLVTVGGSPGLDVQGHRGARGLRPENTLPAFEKALELGVTTLEMDIQTTSDRVLVVSHDQHLDPKRTLVIGCRSAMQLLYFGHLQH